MQKPSTLSMSAKQAVSMYEDMLSARLTDQKNWLLNRAGKVAFATSGQGQEAAQVALGYALEKGKDYIAPYYRDFALVLSFGMSIEQLFLNFFAKKTDPNSGGRQMASHFSNFGLHILSHSSPVATQALHAVGMSYAMSLEGKTDVIIAAVMGEGAANQGEVHEAMNFASIYKLPVLFVVENNNYAISTGIEQQVAGKSVAKRAQSYDMIGKTIDGMDLNLCYRQLKNIIKQVRSGSGPALIELMVKRFLPHTSDDNLNHYMSVQEQKDMLSYDPVKEWGDVLVHQGILTEEQQENLINKIQKQVQQALESAEKAPDPDIDSVYQNVYAEGEV